MAAAETASAAGTRRAVIRSERFVQWQQELSSARRAPYGSRKRTDVEPNQQKESDYVSIVKDSRGLEVWGRENDDYHNGVSKATAKKQDHQPQPTKQSPDAKPAKQEINLEHHKDGLCIVREGLCDGRTNPTDKQSREEQLAGSQQKEQQEIVLTHPVKRRGRRAPTKDQDLKPSTRGADDDAHAKIGLESGLASKRSTRLLTRTLQAEEPPPPPLKVPKLHVVLSRKEVQEDWLKMTGRRYTGKPRKSVLTHLGLGLCTSFTCPSTIRRYLNDP